MVTSSIREMDRTYTFTRTSAGPSPESVVFAPDGRIRESYRPVPMIESNICFSIWRKFCLPLLNNN